jgi:hypothetical protein
VDGWSKGSLQGACSWVGCILGFWRGGYEGVESHGLVVGVVVDLTIGLP